MEDTNKDEAPIPNRKPRSSRPKLSSARTMTPYTRSGRKRAYSSLTTHKAVCVWRETIVNPHRLLYLREVLLLWLQTCPKRRIQMLFGGLFMSTKDSELSSNITTGNPFSRRMTKNKSKNVGVCHGCRMAGHFFGECPKKSRCPWCAIGFLKCFEVEKETENKGKLFECCTLNCGYFEFIKLAEAESSGAVVHDDAKSTTLASKDAIEDFSGMFHNLAQISSQEAVEISVTITIRKDNTSAEGNGKGKEPA